MRPQIYSSNTIRKLLEKNKVCTLDEIMAGLGAQGRMTIFRKLAELPYQTSYSHRGKYYTLKSLCRFNDQGLWTHRKAWFSVYGTLLETGRVFVHRSDAGYSNKELDGLLHVESKQALLHLNDKGLVTREKCGGVYVYLSKSESVRKKQILARGEMGGPESESFSDEPLAHELRAAIILFFGLLDERQRRIFAGLESFKMGAGGDARVARVLGIDPHTVARGRSELLVRDLKIDRVRRKGGGRPTQEKKHQK